MGNRLWGCSSALFVAAALLVGGVAEGEPIFEDTFDAYAPGQPPSPPWTELYPGWGGTPEYSRGEAAALGVTIQVDDSVAISGSSVHFLDTSEGGGSGIRGQLNIQFPAEEKVVAEFYMRTDNPDYEGVFVNLVGDAGFDHGIAFGNPGGHGQAGFIGVINFYQGWVETALLPYSPNTWYYVRRELDCTTNTGAFYVEELDQPGNNATLSIGSSRPNQVINGFQMASSNGEGADGYVDELVINPFPQSPHLLFRTTDRPLSREIPGIEHVAFVASLDREVWESTVVLPEGAQDPSGREAAGDYWDPATRSFVRIDPAEGVQGQHTVGTFGHLSTSPDPASSPVTWFDVVPLDPDLGATMAAKIRDVEGAGHCAVMGEVEPGWLAPLLPSEQKGGGGTFSSVGLTEWAAEQSERTGYQGFIPDDQEAVFIPGEGWFSMLTPELQFWAAKSPQVFLTSETWVQGILDPVDFVITDPLGRRFGFSAELGLLEEIPDAFFSGNADYEQFFIGHALPGEYTIELFGLGAEANAAFGGPLDGVVFSGALADGDPVVLRLLVDPVPEPTTLVILCCGNVALLWARRRRRRRVSG